MALLLKQDNTMVNVKPRVGTHFTLDELQTHVGGYIEIVQCKNPDLILVIDEEGKLNSDKTPNMGATISAKILQEDIIFGDALLCKSSEVK